MDDANRMTAVIDIDDSQEEAAARRHKERMSRWRSDGEAAATAQTRAFQSSHERLVAMADRTADAHRTMFSRIRAGAEDAARGMDKFVGVMSRMALRTAELAGSVGAMVIAVKGSIVAWGAATASMAEHGSVVDGVINKIRALRLAWASLSGIGAVAVVGAEIGAVVAGEYAIRKTIEANRQMRADAFTAARSGSTYRNVSTLGFAGRIAGAGNSYQDLFGGKSPEQIVDLVSQFQALKDPVDRATFAVRNFGEKAEQVYPLLTNRLKTNVERAYELSAALDTHTRESLEHVSQALRAPIDRLHEFGDEFRRLREEAKQAIVVRVIPIVEGAVNFNEGVNRGIQQQYLTGGGKDSLFISSGAAPPLPSDLQFTLGANKAASEAQRRLLEGATGQGVSDRVLRLSGQAISQDSSSAAGLSRRLSDVETKLRKDVDTLGSAIGTSFESTVRTSIIQDVQEATRLRPLVEAARRQEQLQNEVTKLRQEGVPFIQVGSTLVRGADLSRATDFPRGIPTLRTPAEQQAVAAAGIVQAQSRDLTGGLQILPGEGEVFIAPSGSRGSYLGGALSPEILSARQQGYVSEFQNQNRLTLAGTNANVALQSRLLELRAGSSGADEISTAREVASLRQGALQQEYNLTGDIVRFRESSLQNELEMRLRIASVEQRQFDEIKNVSSGLFHTLFTSPSRFGSQLFGTVRDAALRPVEQGLGTLTANVLFPMLHGGGINDVRLVGGAVPVHIMNFGPGGGAGTTVFGGFGGFGGGTIPSFGGSSDLFNLPAPQMWNSPLGLASMIGPGGTAGFAPGPVGVGGGGSGFSFGGLGGLLQNFRHFQLGGFTRSIPRYSMDENGNLSLIKGSHITGLTGAAASGAFAGGTLLAQNGLLGGARGTGGGILEGTMGGALLGFALGGPLGAGIGALAGFGIGLGEKIAGVETPQHEASRLIYSIYHVNLPERSGAVNQIVAMAQQYGGSVSMAVRTSQARQLIELYAQSTGQKSDLFLTTPHAASLVQQGGTLYQGLSYFNGAGYNYASPLPTLGNSAGTIPTYNPYSFIQISLNGQSASDALGGQVTRVANPGYVGSANVAALQSGASRFATAAAVMAPSSIFA